MSPGDIHWVELPRGSGHEQVGRRPAILLQDDAYGSGLPLVIVVPLTGAVAAARFAGTLKIEPTPENGLQKTSIAPVFQIRAVDRHIVREKIGAIEKATLAEIYAHLDRLTGRVSANLPAGLEKADEP